MHHVQNIQYVYLLNKYTIYSIWRLAVRYDAFFKSLGLKGLIKKRKRALVILRHCQLYIKPLLSYGLKMA